MREKEEEIKGVPNWRSEGRKATIMAKIMVLSVVIVKVLMSENVRWCSTLYVFSYTMR